MTKELSRHYEILLKYLYKYQNLDRPVKLLEIGAGNMEVKGLLPKNIIYHSMDFGNENNPTLNKQNKYTYMFNLDNPKIPIKDNSYDIVVCFETLEHVMYPKRVLKEIRRIAKKNALLFFSLPNEYNFVQRSYYLFAKKTMCEEPFEVVEKHLHIHKPRVKDIISFFSEFEIREVYYVWQSVHIPGFIDKAIDFIAKICPSLFSRMVIIRARNNKK
jgi:SAM-dependent methyltransferase